jgi:hypothetical protein
MTSSEWPWLHQALGRGIRALRDRADLRADDIASAGRHFGLKWASSSVSQLEAGTRRVTAEELVLLESVLRLAVGDRFGANRWPPVELTDLLAHTERVRLSEAVTVTASDVCTLLHMIIGAASVDAESGERVLRIPALTGVGDEMTRRLARKFEVEPMWLRQVAELLWDSEGTGLEAVRDRRAIEREPQARGSRRTGVRVAVGREMSRELARAVEIAKTTPWPRSGSKTDRWHGWRERVRERLAAEGLVREQER